MTRNVKFSTLPLYTAVVAILLLGAVFRFHALGQDARFHPDEALFSTFARSAAVNGDWLLHGPLDKTPLTIYASAFSMMLFGVHPLPNGVLDLDIRVGEFAARIPGTMASILIVAVTYRLTQPLYRQQAVSLTAMFITAVSPFAIAFSAMVFTDGLMLLFLVASLAMVARGRWSWSGLFLALGFASKQQALYYLPLIVAVGWAMDGRCCREKTQAGLRTWILRIGCLLLPTVLTFGLLIAWDFARDQPGGIWGLAAANNNPGRLIRANEIIPRLSKWADYAQALAGPGWLTAIFGFLGIAGITWRIGNEPRLRATLIDVALVTYLLAYLLAHWLIAFNTYDRYLLPILPLAILLIARGISWVKDLTQRRKGAKTQGAFSFSATLYLGISAVCVVVLCLGALNASEGRIHVGGDLGEHTGIDKLAAYLDSRRLGAIVYDHWLGWELGYYMGTWSDKRRVYYPTPDALAVGALAQPDPAPRYFAAPTSQPPGPWLNALRKAGFDVSLVFDTPQFVAYELVRAEP